jgi:two-component system response regulator DesR
VCEQHDLDVMVIGARRSDRATLDLISSLSQANPDVRVVIACERSAAGDIRKALDAGARGVVLADDVDEVLVPVLRVVFAGQVSVPGPRGREAGRHVLTMREKQILGLVISGKTNAQIASRLFLAESTVKSHLSSSFAKLGVASRNEAAAFIHDPVSGRGLGIPRFHPNDELSEK